MSSEPPPISHIHVPADPVGQQQQQQHQQPPQYPPGQYPEQQTMGMMQQQQQPIQQQQQYVQQQQQQLPAQTQAFPHHHQSHPHSMQQQGHPVTSTPEMMPAGWIPTHSQIPENQQIQQNHGIHDQQQPQPIMYSPQEQQQQEIAGNPAEANPPNVVDSAAAGAEGELSSSPSTSKTQRRLKNPLSQLSSRFQKSNGADGQNLGFTPTPAMVKAHEKQAHTSAAEGDTERPLYQFQVTKLRSWRTGYVRLLCLYKDRFCTFDPDTHQVTNTWQYPVLSEWMALPKEKDTILLQLNADKLKFKCHNVDRSLVLTALLSCKHECEGTSGEDHPVFRSCARQTRHRTRVAMTLEVTPHGLVERHATTLKIIQTYRYTDITSVSLTADDNTGIELHVKAPVALCKRSRLFFIQSSRRQGNGGRSDLVSIMRDNYEKLGLDLPVSESCSTASWLEGRRELGKTAGPVVSSWEVTKITRRHDIAVVGPGPGWVGGTVRRRLAVTGRAFFMELDGSGVVSCRRLVDLYALVRHGGDQSITLEFVDGTSRKYTLPHRDALLVSLLDAAASLGHNHTIHVTDVTSGGYCLSSPFIDANAAMSSSSSSGGIFQTIAIPMHCLKQLHSASTATYAFLSQSKESSIEEGQKLKVIEECTRVVEACREFNASVPPMGDGLPASPTDKLILGSIGALWGIVSKLLHRPVADSAAANHNNVSDRLRAELTASPIFQALYRLSHAPAGFKGSAELTTFHDCIPLLMSIEDSFTQFWSLRVLSIIMAGPSVSDARDKQNEFVNKSVILETGGADLVVWLVHTLLEAASKQLDGQQQVSDLILMATSDILQSILCSQHDTTKPEHFSLFIEALASGYRALLSTLRSQTPFIIENTALLLQVLTTHAPQTSVTIRDAALSSGIMLQHFYAAIFSPLEGQRFLSRYLCSLWMSGPMDCDEKKLLQRMIPSGFVGYLKMPLLSRREEEKLDEIEQDEMEEGVRPKEGVASKSEDENDASAMESVVASAAAGTNTGRLRSRIQIATATGQENPLSENFRIFFHVLTKDHSLPDLIWNQQTRRELRIALESELQSVKRATEARGGIDHIAWNHQQFAVEYPSLREEVQVGSVYMRLWLQAGDGFIKTWQEPVRLFELLFRRFLCELDRNTVVTIMCIRCLERLYSIHASKIGTFSDIMIMSRSMGMTKSIETQHRLLALVATLLGVSTDEDKHGKINIPGNAEQLLNAESISQLCQFVAWAHTNGIQVGNLLTKVLGDPTGGKQALLTDGTNAGPSGNPSDKPSGDHQVPQQREAPDALCPPVWFVAPAGRIPPPADQIRGPFRVSELMTMMENGDLFSHSLVTASHAENYNFDDEEPESAHDDTAVKETQIDTGKWRMVEQVWQLRWQLCTDGNRSGVYGPSEVGLMALRSLSRLVDLHKSVDSRGVPYYPIPIAKRLLCGLGRDSSSSVVDKNGGIFEAGAILDQRASLSILNQSLLCNDHRVVESAADLLYKLMQHNTEACSKLYLTGVYFFSCSYTGSNFLPLAKLLESTHLNQHFRSGFAAAAKDDDLPMKDRSILGNMLPEGLLFILVKYGFKRFSEVFVGNYDTPEVIWNLEMRKHLVEMIRQHLGDFPKRLWQNTTAKYEYCPLPGVAYKRLEKELFCHNYYLANLCDEVRFPKWPISEPAEVFRACLEEWKKQITRDEEKEEDAQEEARKVLSLKAGDGGRELRRAYRTLARKYHPDKNPAGREMFEAIQGAYELLLPIVERGGKITESSSSSDDDGSPADNSAEGLGGGTMQMQTMQLLLKTQVVIYKRYEKEMMQYKYPAYQLLLSCLDMSSLSSSTDTDSDPAATLESCLIKASRVNFIRTAVELVYQTCLVSPMNAEELVSENGIPVLESLLDFYIRAARLLSDETRPKTVSATAASEKAMLDIISHIVHTIAGVAFYENGRSAILSLADPSRLCLNWTSCISGNFIVSKPGKDAASSIKKFALEGVSNMAKESELQNLLIGSGIIWPLTKNLLNYDPTLEDVTTSENDDDDVNMSQATTNAQARLSARALGMLCGVLTDASLITPSNPVLLAALQRLLTTPIARMLRNKRTLELLRTLNTNIETPVRIWNIQMREELSTCLIKLEKERCNFGFRPVEEELKLITTSFQYQTVRDELIIAGVYIRVFNSMGGGQEGLREIANTTNFAKEIMIFIAKSLNEDSEFCSRSITLSSKMKEQVSNAESFGDIEATYIPVNDPRFVMAVKALRLLVRIDGLVDDVLCDDDVQGSSILLSLLELPQDAEAFDVSTDILALMSPKQVFADAVARQGALWRLLMVLERPDGENGKSSSDSRVGTRRQERGWSLLESLSSSPSIAATLVHSSGWLELLGILAGYSEFSKTWAARSGAAKTLSRLLWDPKTGPTAAPLLQRFLPVTLTIVLKEEGPDIMLKLFDGESETPELIWDASMRTELRKAIADQLASVLAARKESGSSTEELILPPKVRARYKKLEDELYIGGVYVRLFLKEPTFNLRDPTTFLEMLLHRWTHELETFSSSDPDAGPSTTGSDSRAVAEATQDALQLVTSASVYLCKVREALCDKLAEWGYMARSLAFMESVLEKDLIGTPLLSILRLLHVASTRRVNVEALAVAGGSGGKHGVVDCSIQAIGDESLHKDCAFIIEMLKNIFKDALGDVKKAQEMQKAGILPPQHQDSQQSGRTPNAAFYAMAPSPAPGLDPVSDCENFFSDLEAFYAMAPSPAPGLNPVSQSDDPLSFLASGPARNQPVQAVSNTQQSRQVPVSAHPGSSNSYNMQTAPNINQNGRQFVSANNSIAQQQQVPNYSHQSNQPRQNQYHQNTMESPVAIPTGQPSYTNVPGRSGILSSSLPYHIAGQAPGSTGAVQNVHQSQTQTSPHSTQQQYQDPLRPMQGRGDMSMNQQMTYANMQQNGQSQQTPVTQQQISSQQAPIQSFTPQQTPSVQQMRSPQSAPIHTPQQQQQSFMSQMRPTQQQPPLQTSQQQQQTPTVHQMTSPHQGQTPLSQQQQTLSEQRPLSITPQQQRQQQPNMTQQMKSPGHAQMQYAQQQQQQQQAPMVQQLPMPATPQQQSAPMMMHQQGASQQMQMGSQPQMPGAGVSQPSPSAVGQQQPFSPTPAMSAGSQGTPMMASSMPQQQEQQQFQQTHPTPSMEGSGIDARSTMPPQQDAPPPQQQQPFEPTPMSEGAGIDARSKPEPSVIAEQTSLSSPGAPGCAQGRILLLQSALACQLAEFLVSAVLENPTLQKVKDPAATKVHTVELLKLLTMDPGYGLKFQLLLDDIPAWKKYKSQDHSLFITGSEQKADYFLTDGDKTETKLLTQKGEKGDDS